MRETTDLQVVHVEKVDVEKLFGCEHREASSCIRSLSCPKQTSAETAETLVATWYVEYVAL